MKTNLLPLAVLLVSVLPLRAEETQSKFNATASPKAKAEWNTSTAHMNQIIRQKRETTGLRIGKSDYVVSGPLIQELRRQRSPVDRSLGKKILRLPIVSWFVPQPMPSLPDDGKYLGRGESGRPWAAIASGTAPGSRNDAVTHEARTSLISIHR